MLHLFTCGCKQPALARLRRNGLLDSFFFRLGYFPWECRNCRKIAYRAKRGTRKQDSHQNEASRMEPALRASHSDIARHTPVARA